MISIKTDNDKNKEQAYMYGLLFSKYCLIYFQSVFFFQRFSSLQLYRTLLLNCYSGAYTMAKSESAQRREERENDSLRQPISETIGCLFLVDTSRDTFWWLCAAESSRLRMCSVQMLLRHGLPVSPPILNPIRLNFSNFVQTQQQSMKTADKNYVHYVSLF